MHLLHKAIQEKDIKSIKLQSHSIKSSSANIFAKVLQNFAFQIESNIKDNQLDMIQHLFSKMEFEFDNVINVIKDEGFLV